MNSKPHTLFIDERLNRHLGKTAIDAWALAQAVSDLEQYYREPAAAISERYWASPKAPDDHDPEALLAFYQTSDRYVYESTYTEGYADHQRMARLVVKAVQRWRLTPVLDFGGGGGGLTMVLGSRGIPCEYADVPGKLSDFVRWRFSRRGLAVPIHDATQALPEARYRAILAVDVLEHVADLEATLQNLKAALQPGGWLLGTQSFSEEDPLHVSSLHCYDDVRLFDRLMQAQGFRYLGRLKPDPWTEQLARISRRPIVWGVRLSPRLKGGGNLLVYGRAS